MRIVRCSSRLLGGEGVWPAGGVCPGVCVWPWGCLPRGSICLGGVHHSTVDRHLWKYNLSATTVADGKNKHFLRCWFTSSQWLLWWPYTVTLNNQQLWKMSTNLQIISTELYFLLTSCVSGGKYQTSQTSAQLVNISKMCVTKLTLLLFQNASANLGSYWK